MKLQGIDIDRQAVATELADALKDTCVRRELVPFILMLDAVKVNGFKLDNMRLFEFIRRMILQSPACLKNVPDASLIFYVTWRYTGFDLEFIKRLKEITVSHRPVLDNESVRKLFKRLKKRDADPAEIEVAQARLVAAELDPS